MPFCGRGSNIRWQNLILLICFHIYIVQCDKEDCGILWIGWAVGPCFTEQVFQLSSANTTQTVGEFI